ncbi:D-alanyl-D-alanine carboxypeptidase [Pseudarthrobacter sp. PvP004]|uniref:serine hydrolase domain-containing protein n=1 Tax=Pseudarthrobacter sp. PvP004 TaxID=2817850 RepID=UPI001AE57DDA|nr:serine hydrolase [Pseudarthrobacter sp. PvP004]MBP2269211.1 D-alanyl-D-alanine carboxypeptidase [Pseudarthrobacter sp. PvP004]
MQSKTRFFPTIITATALVLAGALPACTGPSPSPSPSATPPAATDSLDFAMRSVLDKGATAVVAQVRWPEGEWSKAYGVRDLDSKRPAQPGDRVSIASVTKTMTAVSVMKLVEDGLIGLDDPVNGMLDSFTTVLKPPGPITVRQLLGHTSGMPSYQEAMFRTVDDILPAAEQRLSLQRGLEITGTLPWEYVGNFRYSDSNYLALGQLLEKLRGKPYSEVLRDDIVKPLGLSHTTVDDPLHGAPDMIQGYITIRGQRVGGGPTPDQLGSPAHGVVSTMSDVNSFLGALFRGQLVSHSSLEEMKKTSRVPSFGLGMWKWSQDCTGAHRYGGRGGYLNYRTIATSSADGRYQATVTMVPAPLPSPLEDPEAENTRDLWSDQIQSALLETLDRLCQ